MSSVKNAFGLSRNIPAEVRREVRRRSGYGCVICRELLCEYEHIEPSFVMATSHDPNDICLLCSNHHDLKTRGRLSASQVRSAYAQIQNSAHPPSLHQLHFSGYLRITLGNAVFDYTPSDASLIEYDSQPLLKLTYVPDDVFGGYRPSLSGRLADRNGTLLFEIDDNVINFAKEGFDIEAVGPVITIRNALRKIAIKITIQPPSGIIINQLVMKHGEVEFDFNRNFGCVVPTKNGSLAKWCMPELNSKGATSAISYTSDRSKWNPDELSMVGGVGCMMPSCGLTFAKGSGSMLISAVAGKMG
jgi:hypothetical protein